MFRARMLAAALCLAPLATARPSAQTAGADHRSGRRRGDRAQSRGRCRTLQPGGRRCARVDRIASAQPGGDRERHAARRHHLQQQRQSERGHRPRRRAARARRQARAADGGGAGGARRRRLPAAEHRARADAQRAERLHRRSAVAVRPAAGAGIAHRIQRRGRDQRRAGALRRSRLPSSSRDRGWRRSSFRTMCGRARPSWPSRSIGCARCSDARMRRRSRSAASFVETGRRRAPTRCSRSRSSGARISRRSSAIRRGPPRTCAFSWRKARSTTPSAPSFIARWRRVR